jgi:protein-disulfide isomerase
MAHVPQLGELSIGSSSAPVVVVEYASATCSHCAQFHIRVWPQIHTSYIASGKVRWIFRELPLDETAMGAFMLARCLPAEQFFQTLQILFQQQKLWAGGERSARSELFRIMSGAGMKRETFDRCLERSDLAHAIYTIAKTAHEKFDVKGTPTFFVNGRRVRGAQDLATFKSMLDTALIESGK